MYRPKHAEELTREEREATAESHIFPTEKDSGDTKACCAGDGSKQRKQEGHAKGEATLPTVSSEALFVTSAAEVHKRCGAAVADLPGAFLHACARRRVHTSLRGRLAKLLVVVNPKLYRKYVAYGAEGVPMLCAEMSKALYGMLESALDFYLKFRADLEKHDFPVSPCDP